MIIRDVALTTTLALVVLAAPVTAEVQSAGKVFPPSLLLRADQVLE